MNDNKDKYKKIIKNQKENNPELFYYLLTRSKDITKPFLIDKTKDSELNDDYGYFTDSFTTNHHNKKHLLFAGCSITAGCGVNSITDSWSFKLYNDLNQNKDCSGYFNVSIAGGAPIEILLNVLKYIANYGNPDYIFILFSNYGRDWNKFNKENNKNGIISEMFVINLYGILHSYCKLNNIKLITTSWVDTVPGITDFIHLDIQDLEIAMHKDMIKNFNSYYQIDNKRFAENTFKYIQDADTYMTIVGTDGSHPSEAVHHAWYKEFLYRMGDVNVNNGN
jgi:hypothetical protein